MKILLLLCITFAACEEGVKTLEEPKKPSNVKKMEVKANQEFKILLNEAPYAGYTWRIINQEALKASKSLTFVKKEYERIQKTDKRFTRIDGPAKANFVFKAGEASNEAAVIEMVYGRSWLKDYVRALKYEITIVN